MLKKIKKISIYSIIILLLFATGCQDFLDVNHDPDRPEDSSVELVYPAAVDNTVNVFGSYTMMLGAIWSQQWTAINFFHAEETYNVPAGQYNYDIGTWRGLYTRALEDYEWVRKTAREDSNWTYYLMATAMQCYTYQVLADLFEDIPIHGALEGYPVEFQMEEAVYDTIFARLDEALSHDLDAETCQKPEEDDVIFNGDMDKWIAFVNTLKMKMFLRERVARESHALNGLKDLFENNKLLLNEDVAYDMFVDEAGRDNPMYGMEFRGGNISMRASRTFIELLKDTGDPRIDYLFSSPDENVHAGLWQGDYLNDHSNVNWEDPQLSRPRITPTMPFYFFTKAQINFMKAEVAEVFGGDISMPKDVEGYYEDAIDADATRLMAVFADSVSAGHFDEINVDDIEDLNSYGSNIEGIMVQKWIACANTMPLEIFFDHNKTGYPQEYEYKLTDEEFKEDDAYGKWVQSPTSVLTPPANFPKRLLYSATELNRNPNSPEEHKTIDEPLWWDGEPYSY